MMREHKYSVNVDPSANDRMIDHVRFLAKVSVPAAERLYTTIETAIASLQDNPESCPLYTMHGFNDVKLRYKLCGKRYRIVFEIIENDVFIYDIQDCRQDSDKNLV